MHLWMISEVIVPYDMALDRTRTRHLETFAETLSRNICKKHCLLTIKFCYFLGWGFLKIGSA